MITKRNQAKTGLVIFGLWLLFCIFAAGGWNGLYSQQYGVFAGGINYWQCKVELYDKDHESRKEEACRAYTSLRDENTLSK